MFCDMFTATNTLTAWNYTRKQILDVKEEIYS